MQGTSPGGTARRKPRAAHPQVPHMSGPGASMGTPSCATGPPKGGVSPMTSDRLRTPEVDSLLAAFGALSSDDERYAFLLDVATVREIQDMAQRLAVARMLDAGEHYTRIQEVTGASSTTISRVSRSLNYGAEGYRTVIDRLASLPEGGDE